MKKDKSLLPLSATAILIWLFIFVLLSGCADQQSVEACVEGSHQYGFWAGLWHGWIIFFSWIGSIFSDDIAVYATNNNGGWYNFGFMLGTGSLFIGGSRAKS